MEYFAGLDVSMAETQICVMGRNGAVSRCGLRRHTARQALSQRNVE
jgi:hypothetical protein